MDELKIMLTSCLDSIDAGVIAIDVRGRIQICNKKAIQIFGIDPRSGPGHPEGSIQTGDIALIADTCLGLDDGHLTPEDLVSIGINPMKLRIWDGFVTIGVYGDGAGSGIIETNENKKIIEVKRNINGMELYSGIDFHKKQITIKAGKELFSYNYNRAFGHIVLLDGNKLNVKFYQKGGYTARKEEIKNILAGCKYAAKGPQAKLPELIGRDVMDFYPDSTTIKQLIEMARGNDCEPINKENSIINGIYVRSLITPILDHGQNIIGAKLIVEDISEIKELTKQRDHALASVEQLTMQMNKSKIQIDAFKNIVGVSGKIQKAIEWAIKASDYNTNILLLGESGTGKNLFAEAIHQASSRRNAPFVYINCASIPEHLLESELFGYDKGAFTGALPAGKIGRIEMGDKGTIFLDEIAELPLHLQAKLLYFMQNKAFVRIGGLKQIQVDVRIIAATNKNLEELIAKKLFREDLYYRIHVMCIPIPALRERKEDIEPLVRHLLPQICSKIGVNKKTISQEVLDLLKNHHWPGNIRELENVLERSINVMQGDIITSKDLPPEFTSRLGRKVTVCNSIMQTLELGAYQEVMKKMEKELLIKTLQVTNGSRKTAMEILKMGKTNFYGKLREHSII